MDTEIEHLIRWCKVRASYERDRHETMSSPSGQKVFPEYNGSYGLDANRYERIADLLATTKG